MLNFQSNVAVEFCVDHFAEEMGENVGVQVGTQVLVAPDILCRHAPDRLGQIILPVVT